MRSTRRHLTREPITSKRQLSRRRDTHTQRPERAPADDGLVQPRGAAEVAVREERRRLAHELHDSVAQTLFGITLNASRVLTLLERSEIRQVHTIVSEMLRQATDSQRELRALVHNLRSDESSQLQGGLTGAL